MAYLNEIVAVVVVVFAAGSIYLAMLEIKENL